MTDGGEGRFNRIAGVRAAEVFTVSPSLNDPANSVQQSLCRSRANGVPVRALKVLPQILQKYRFNPLERPQVTAPPVAQCGQLRAVPIRSSSSPITASSDG